MPSPRFLIPVSFVIPAILLVACIPPRAFAGSEPPSLLATAYNTQRKLVRTADGTLFLAITANVSGVPQVRVLSSTDGVSWTELVPPSLTGSPSDRASLAVDSRDRLHLAWTEVTIQDRQIFYARYAGSQWTSPDQLSSSPGYAGFPSLAVDATDRVHVVWYGFDGARYQVYYRRLEAGGWNAERALTSENVDATNPAIALGPEGHIHIVWFREHTTLTYLEVAYLRVEGDVVVDTEALSAPRVDSIDPTIAVETSGKAHVAWDARVMGSSVIQHVERESDWSTIETITPSSFEARHPSLGLGRDSRLQLVWESSDGQIFGQMRNGSWSDPSPYGSQGVARYPSVRWSYHHNLLCGEEGDVDVVWTEELPGGVRVAHRSIGEPQPCPPRSTSEGPWIIVAPIAGIFGVIAALVVFRGRARKPPGKTLE